MTGCIANDSKKLPKRETKNINCNSFSDIIIETEDNDSLCKLGPSIEGKTGDMTIRVRPLRNVQDDHYNLQWAADNVASGGTVELCEGVFYLGEGDRKKTVTITKGIKLEGKKINGEWLTTIKGGGSPFGLIPDPEIGPFLVSNTQDPCPSIFKKIWLRDWTSEAIFINGCNGFTLDNCKLSHPVVGPPGLGFLFIHAIFAYGSDSKGEFVVKNNMVDLLSYFGEKPHDSQLLGIFGPPSPAFTKIWIANNTVVGNDECFEVIGNDSGTQSSEIIIENNTVDINFDVGGRWPNHFAFLIFNNKNTSQVRIENNRVKIANSIPPAHGGMGAFAFGGDNFLVRDNLIDFKDFDGTVIQLGFNGVFGPMIFGSSLSNSVIENNTFSGSVQGPALLFAGGVFNRSHNNIFKFGDSLTDLGTDVTIQTSFTRACDNIFEGNTGIIKGKLDEECWY